MNFLAHSLMGFDDSALITGQFCGDFVRGSRLSHFPQGVERGIRLHRRLDVFTDTFPALKLVRGGITDIPRRFTGIVIDVLFDHYLARRWGQISPYTLDDHALRVHEALSEHKAVLPDSLQRFMVILRKEDILQNNQHIEAIELTLARLSRRSPRFSALAIPESQLLQLRELLQESFEAFYPALNTTAIAYLSNNPVKGAPV